MSSTSRLPVIAGVLALLMAAFALYSAFTGPVLAAVPALVILAGGVEILRRRVWGAYGIALLPGAQVLLAAFLSLRDRAVPLAPLAISAAGSIAFTVLFLYAGRALARSGACRGPAWPWILATLLLVAPLLFVQAFVIPNSSMEKTILVGDRIFVLRVPRPTPHRGQIVAFRYPRDRNQTFVKRVVGMPGDRIRIAEKVLYRNGTRLNEPYAIHSTDYMDLYRDFFPGGTGQNPFPEMAEAIAKNTRNGELVVPDGSYFVMGDNRDLSLDSRYWGFVPDADIIGTPLFIYDSAGMVESTQQRGPTRWERIFKRL